MDYKYEHTEGAKKINFLMSIAGGIQYKKVKKAGKNCAKTEEQTLRAILEYAKDSEWGKAHNFAKILEAPDAATLYKLWNENVPPQDYEDFRPYIDRCKNGEENVLYPGKAICMPQQVVQQASQNGFQLHLNITTTFIQK